TPVITITYRYHGPRIAKRFNLAKADKYLQLNFADNGIGFDEEYAEKIFSIFQRINARSQYEGTGIGLAVCKKVVENHGGVIFATAKPNEGANFTIIIPA